MGVRVLCFAHAEAGVSASGRRPMRTGPGVEAVPVLLPARDGRRREPRVRGPAALPEDLRPVVEPVAQAPEPYLLYGHGPGGPVACTPARHRHAQRLLSALPAAGAPAPPDVPLPPAGCADLPERELLQVRDIFDAVAAHAAPGGLWHRCVLPVLRDDARRAAADEPPPPPVRLPVPLLAVCGQDDVLVSPRDLAGWARWTTARFVRRTVPGGRLFVRGRALPRLTGRAARMGARAPAPALAPVSVVGRVPGR